MSKKFPPQSIAECLDSQYGISATNLIPLNMGADINASTYKVETQDGPTYFVKQKQGHHSDISVKLLAFLNESGIQQVIPSVKTVDGKLTLHINDCTLSVYPFVDGQNGFSCGLSDDQWIILGKALRQVHELDLTPWIKNHIGKETYSTKWREAATALLDKQMDGGPVSDKVAVKLQAFIKENRSLIHHLVNRAEHLSLLVQEQSPKFVLCHSDIHGGNVLIDQNGSIFIVDWDEPIIASKERDLMFIGGGVANVWNDPREEGLFYDGYGKTSIDKVALAYYRYERIVVDIVEYAQVLLLTLAGGEDREKMYKQFLDMFEPNGVVDIALKTDDELKHGGKTMGSSTCKILNHLSDTINNLYGYVKLEGSNFGEPSINSGPCGPFANVFLHRWNERFKRKVHIVVVMIKNSDECWHILIRLPDGMLFDGGSGVHDEKVYKDNFEVKDIKEYDLELLEKYSYGLNRNYPRYCPEFSIEKVDSIIVEHLGRISQRDWS